MCPASGSQGLHSFIASSSIHIAPALRQVCAQQGGRRGRDGPPKGESWDDEEALSVPEAGVVGQTGTMLESHRVSVDGTGCRLSPPEPLIWATLPGLSGLSPFYGLEITVTRPGSLS